MMPVLTIAITERECANCGRVDVDPALAGITGNRARLIVFDCPTCVELSMAPPQIRPWIKVLPTGCWEWQRTIGDTGYAQRWDPATRRRVYVHRWVYEQVVEPIPDGFHIDHLCRNRACVRPSHLEAVTQQENNRRVTASYCRNGHQRTPETVVVQGQKRQRVRCKECLRAFNERRRLAYHDEQREIERLEERAREAEYREMAETYGNPEHILAIA